MPHACIGVDHIGMHFDVYFASISVVRRDSLRQDELGPHGHQHLLVSASDDDLDRSTTLASSVKNFLKLIH